MFSFIYEIYSALAHVVQIFGQNDAREHSLIDEVCHSVVHLRNDFGFAAQPEAPAYELICVDIHQHYDSAAAHTVDESY